MQVTVETTAGLERRMKVVVPSATVEDKVAARLKDAAGKVRINGFRPGKVPMREIKRRFGAGIRQEVSGELIQETYFDAVQQKELKPAGMPNIENLSNESGADLEFEAVFEVYPEITLGEFSQITVDKPVAMVADEDLDRTVELLRKQHIEYHLVERAATSDDKLNLNYAGEVDGEMFEGGSGEGVDLVLGSNTMIPGFEDGLTGCTAGGEITLQLQFPEEYHAKDLASKPVQFKVSINSISEPVIPELNDEFFKKFGVEEGGEEAFRAEIKSNMQRELDSAIKNRVRNQALEGLVKANELEIPKSLVDMEIDRLRQDAVRQFGGPNAAKIDASILPAEMFADQAQQRVAMSLLVTEIISKHNLEVDKERVRETITGMASTYDEPQRVIEWYYSNEQQMDQIENMVLEEQVVECILNGAQVTETTMTYQEALSPPPRAASDEASDQASDQVSDQVSSEVSEKDVVEKASE